MTQGAGPAGRAARPVFRWWALALALAVAAPVGWLVFIADGWTVNRLVVRIWSVFLSAGVPITPDDMDAALNTLMLAPLAGLAALCLPRVRWWLWGLAGLAGSLLIEAIQYAYLPRDADPWDVLFNTLGAFAGAGVGELLNRWLSRRAARAPRPTDG